MLLEYAALTNKGGREVNEDAVDARVRDDAALFILADGLGGHGSGEVASGMAAAAALSVFDRADSDFKDRLANCAAAGQNAVLEEQLRTGQAGDFKTTLVLLQLEGERSQWLHVGDSRLYWFEKGRLAGRTADHSVPQMLAIQGEIRESDIRFHEDRNRLTRVLGTEWETPKYTLADEYRIKAPVSFLLCSDGFWELVEEKEMIRQLKRVRTPKEWLDEMEKAALKAGAHRNMDNYSAVAVWVR